MMASSNPNRPRPSPLAGGRLGRIVRGYLAACFVAAWGLPLVVIIKDLIAGNGLRPKMSDFGIIVGGLFVVLLVSAAPLATAAIVVSESWRLRSVWPYVAAGVLIGVVIEVGAGLIADGGSGTWSPALFGLVALAGAAAGAAYWAIAVRGAPLPPARD